MTLYTLCFTCQSDDLFMAKGAVTITLVWWNSASYSQSFKLESAQSGFSWL